MKFKSTIAACLLALLSLNSCKKLASRGLESKDFAAELSEFIRFNGWERPLRTDSLNDATDLYIDYSTCVAEAKNSAYYRTVHPVIVDANPNYWSIKGSKIRQETANRQMVYQLLNTVREINYADIKGAVEQIVHGTNHAILITDGEYFMPGNVRDNLNNPYLADAFRVWLQRGFDIYIYSEPYLETGRFEKFRYYIFFTDDDAENNIRERFDRSAPANSDVEMFHLSGKRPEVHRSSEYPCINISLSPNEELHAVEAGYDIQEYYTKWKKIYKYILDNAYDENGNPLEDGDYLVRGLFIDNGPHNSYKVNGIRLETYNIGEAFEAYRMAKINEETPSKCSHASASRLFAIDEKLFAQTGEIAIRLDQENRYDGLAGSPNLLKVDIVADKVDENFTRNDELGKRFQWKSISGTQADKYNTSFYESIRQVLLDPTMNPVKRNSNVLYTIYISTYSM